MISIVAVSFLGSFAAGLSDRIKNHTKHGGSLSIVSWDPEIQSEEMSGILRRTKPSALVAISLRPSEAVLTAYRSAGVPVVLIDEEAPRTASVGADNVLGGRMAAQHLLDRGHTQITVVTGRIDVPGGLNAAQRLKGAWATLGDRGLQVVNHIEVVDYSLAEGEVLYPRIRGTAVFCAAGDQCAAGIVRAAKKEKRPIPKELAIVGYDDASLAQSTTPNLTTIRQPLDEIARVACELIRSGVPQRVSCKPELIVRDST
jgi:LacI family transcriptional regulator